MKQFLTHSIAGVFVLALITTSIPLSAHAQMVTGYQPRTQEELMAYLYGRIAQLMEIKRLLDEGKTLTQAAQQSEVSMVVIETQSATKVEATTAILRGEVLLFGKATATAWFEYGQDPDFLDMRTSRIGVRSAYDRAVRSEVRNLEDDERYYFRIVTENIDKTVTYGKVYQFNTDELDE